MDKRLLVGLAVIATIAGCGSSSGGGGSGGGDKLPLGKEAVVKYTATASGSTPAATTTLGVTALSVRKGTQAQLTAAGFKLDPENKDDTPYYVDARYANKGNGTVPRSLSVGMEDTKGDSIPTTIVISLSGKPYALCKDSREGTLAPGQRFDGCTLFLVPKGATLDRVRFVSQGPDAKITFTDWAVR